VVVEDLIELRDLSVGELQLFGYLRIAPPFAHLPAHARLAMHNEMSFDGLGSARRSWLCGRGLSEQRGRYPQNRK